MMSNKCANFAPGSQLRCHGTGSLIYTEGKSTTWTHRPACAMSSLAPSPMVRSLISLLWPLEMILLKGGKTEH